MNLLLARHGNTFAPSDPVVWAGATNDLPLVQAGIEQAHRLASELKSQQVPISTVYCSSLSRTSHYASIICQTLGLSKPIVDPRLHEIDYGEWTGLTHEEVVSRFGEADLKNWEEKSIWPASGRWQGSQAAVIAEIKTFASDLVEGNSPDDTSLIVTSNGRLRYFLTLIPEEFESRVQSKTFKVRTGNLCKITFQLGQFKMAYWDRQPHPSFKI